MENDMERQIVVTIGRSFGSNGRRIGEGLAKELGIKCYDRNLIEMAAKESGMDWKVVGNADEKLVGRILKFKGDLILYRRTLMIRYTGYRRKLSAPS